MCFCTGEAHDQDVQVVELPIVDSLHPRPPYLPLAIPEDLAPRLQRLHGDPSVWWVSQFVKYLVRPQAWLEKEIQETCVKLGFKHPIIGSVYLSSSLSLSDNHFICLLTFLSICVCVCVFYLCPWQTRLGGCYADKTLRDKDDTHDNDNEHDSRS